MQSGVQERTDVDGMVYKGNWKMRGQEEERPLGGEEENAIRKLYKTFRNAKGRTSVFQQ